MASLTNGLLCIEDFTRDPQRISAMFGLSLLKRSIQPKWYQKLLGRLSIMCMVLLGLQGGSFLVIHFGNDEHFLDTMLYITNMYPSFLTLAKVFVIYFHQNDALQEVLDELDRYFPKTKLDQIKTNLHKHWKFFQTKIKIYGALLIFQLGFFLLSDLFASTYKVFVKGEAFQRQFPYFFWLPCNINATTPMLFELISIMLTLASCFTMFIWFAIDLLLYGLLTILCMELKSLRKKFQTTISQKSEKDLKLLVIEHNCLIR